MTNEETVRSSISLFFSVPSIRHHESWGAVSLTAACKEWANIFPGCHLAKPLPYVHDALSLRGTAHFMSPLDKHNLSQGRACTLLAHLIPITANYTHAAGRPQLFRGRPSCERWRMKLICCQSSGWFLNLVSDYTPANKNFIFQTLVLTHLYPHTLFELSGK